LHRRALGSELGGPALRGLDRDPEHDFTADTASAGGVCNRCGFVIVVVRAWGCKNPCANCGTVYPLGDCSD
jgi:hypothetical protein